MLVEYSDSDEEEVRGQPAVQPKPVIGAAEAAARTAPLAPAPPSVALPSADSLFGGTGAALPSLPSPGSLKRPAAGGAVQPGLPKRAAGSALPRQSSAASGLLLPPQLRGRSNVSTEDNSVFTAKTQAALRRGKEGPG